MSLPATPLIWCWMSTATSCPPAARPWRFIRWRRVAWFGHPQSKNSHASLVGQPYAFPVAGPVQRSLQRDGLLAELYRLPDEPLGYLTVWPTGQGQPIASTLNAPTGTTTANPAMVQAGTSGEIEVLASNDTNLVIDVNGYFAPPTSVPGGLSLFTLTPCRVLDTRLTTGAFSGTLAVNAPGNSCALPSLAQAIVMNATVVPSGPLGYLTLWPNGQTQPVASTLNALDGETTSNMAVVPTTNGFVDAFASNPTQLVVDLFNYFATPSGLNGNYTFSVNGFNSGGPVLMVGSFVADGQGNITSGVLDYNDGSGESPDNNPTPQTIGAGSVYSINPNGLGTMTITTNIAVFSSRSPLEATAAEG